jgi:aspartyl-tRNA(Asn)/glutamyl-tRNA(Gln) amidotransferase subunit B
VAIERIHLEEDTAQSTHDTHKKSLVNFNRSSVPLMELVTKPVIHDATTAVRFAKELQLLLRYLGAGLANMEKGEMRVEANVSVSKDEKKLGTKTEVKNLNSFKAVEKAIEFEIIRQTSLLEKDQPVLQETRGWDNDRGETYSQRSKESSHDYRYYPDPDIPKLKISEIGELGADLLKKELPELPWIKRDRYKKDFGMTDKEVAIFIESPEIANYFESIISVYKRDAKKTKLTINYLLTDYLSILKEKNAKVNLIPHASFAELISMVADGHISSRGAKDLLSLLSKDNEATPKSLAEKHNLIQKSDSNDLAPIIEKVISDNLPVVAEYKKGKTTSIQFLIGQAMKATKGSANPEVVKKLLTEKLK